MLAGRKARTPTPCRKVKYGHGQWDQIVGKATGNSRFEGQKLPPRAPPQRALPMESACIRLCRASALGTVLFGLRALA